MINYKSYIYIWQWEIPHKWRFYGKKHEQWTLNSYSYRLDYQRVSRFDCLQILPSTSFDKLSHGTCSHIEIDNCRTYMFPPIVARFQFHLVNLWQHLVKSHRASPPRPPRPPWGPSVSRWRNAWFVPRAGMDRSIVAQDAVSQLASPQVLSIIPATLLGWWWMMDGWCRNHLLRYLYNWVSYVELSCHMLPSFYW